MNASTDQVAAELNQISEMGLWDFMTSVAENGDVLVLGSNDFDYYHHLELEFHGVMFKRSAGDVLSCAVPSGQACLRSFVGLDYGRASG